MIPKVLVALVISNTAVYLVAQLRWYFTQYFQHLEFPVLACFRTAFWFCQTWKTLFQDWRYLLSHWKSSLTLEVWRIWVVKFLVLPLYSSSKSLCKFTTWRETSWKLESQCNYRVLDLVLLRTGAFVLSIKEMILYRSGEAKHWSSQVVSVRRIAEAVWSAQFWKLLGSFVY